MNEPAFADLKFLSRAVEGELRLVGVEGRERISELYALRLLLVRDEPLSADELDGLLQRPCAVALGEHAGDIVHGLLEHIERFDNAGEGPHHYLATLVPRASLLDLTRRSRVHQGEDVLTMVHGILARYGLREGAGFEVRVGRPLVAREYVVQYEESDWDFVSRWLEAEGLFYWFEHHASSERLVVADSNPEASRFERPIRYRRRNDVHAPERTIWDWDLGQRRVPARVAVFDYNYRAPGARVRGQAIVDEQNGFGTATYYGAHVKSDAEADVVAGLRAEAHACRRRIYTGHSDCPDLRVGHLITLEGHHDGAADGDYLVVGLDYRAGLPVRDQREGGEMTALKYRARIEAVPASVPFRPARQTPWPTIVGVINGHVVSDTPGKVAELDELGRYKVRMVFDTAGVNGSGSSRWIRMAQSYSGAGYGTHFPLHKGAEVLVAHVGGDPDRPIIVGAVPNPATVSPATNHNASQSVVQTASGIRIEMEDLQS